MRLLCRLCNAWEVISSWTEQAWDEVVVALAGEEKARVQAALQSFLLGVAYRQEEVHAHELSELLGKTNLSPEARAELVDDIQFSLGLLAAYDRLLDDDDDDEDAAADVNGREAGVG